MGDPTELALLGAAKGCGHELTTAARREIRRLTLHFDPHLKRMSTADEVDGRVELSLKGAPESVIGLCDTMVSSDGSEPVLEDEARSAVDDFVTAAASSGLRVLAIARRPLAASEVTAADRGGLERGLCLVGLVAMIDPPRPEVAAAIALAHAAGIRIHVVTGDNGLTAAEIARQVGIGTAGTQIVTGEQLDALGGRACTRRPVADRQRDHLRESSPEAPSSGSPTHCVHSARWLR